MNIVQRLALRLRVSTVAALRRVVSRVNAPLLRTPRQRVFASARSDRLTGDLFSARTSGAQDLRNDLQRLRNRSRTLVRDNAEAKRYVSLFPENVVGHQGVLCKPSALRGEQSDTALNDRVLEAWEDWSLPTNCTVDGRLGLVELEQTMMRLWAMDGEVLLRKVRGRGKYGLQLQLLDADQLDDSKNVEPSGDGSWIRQGVEMDRFARPTAYWLWESHPNDPKRGRVVRVPADEIVHLFIPWRPGVTRGIPWLHAAITKINMLDGYFEAALVAARVAASVMGVIKVPENDPSSQDESTPGDMPVEMAPGQWIRTGPGEEASLLDPKHPTTSFNEFYKGCVRAIAQAGGVSYTSLSGDLAEVNYSSIRAGLLSERDHYRMLQQMLVRYFLDDVYAEWLRMASLTPALRVSPEEVLRAQRVRWQPRGFPWVDPLNDIEALKEEISLGINSRTNAAAERGRDFEKVLEQLDTETALAKEYGVDVSGAPPRPLALPNDATATAPGSGRALRVINA